MNEIITLREETCKHCGCKVAMLKYIKPHIGAYCAGCTHWIKWLSKKEKAEHGIVTPEDFKNKQDGKNIEVSFIEEFDRELNSDIDDEVPWYD